METWTRDQVKNDLIDLLKDAREDFDHSMAVTEDTGLFRDLGFESIDAVGLSSSVEAHFNRSFPFPEFLMLMKQQNAKDITVGQLLEFLYSNLKNGVPATES